MNPQTILITGATTGIGRQAAKHFASLGHTVIATGRKRDALESLRAESPTIQILTLDVTDSASIAAAVTEVDRLTRDRGLDVLINNAGYGMAAPTIETTDADLRAQYETNVFGLMAVTRAFAPRMMARRAGRILNVSSVGGLVTFPMFGVYNSSKYAVEALSDALRNELAPFGVQVVLIEPGPIKTEFANRSMDYVARYRSTSSPYAAVYAMADKIAAQADAQAVSPQVIARVMERAISVRRPRARYIAPFSSRILVGLLGILPTRFVDFLMRKIVGLTATKLKLPAPTLEPAKS